jgi:hypothetical protein
MPGPGAYNEVNQRPGTSYTFGGGKRNELAKRSDSPGPGHYKVSDNVGKTGK